MIATIGFILAGLNAIVGGVLTFRRIAEERVEKLRDAIRDELDYAYRELMDQVSQSSDWRAIGVDAGKNPRLARLHFALLCDFPFLTRTATMIHRSLWLALLFFLVATGSSVLSVMIAEARKNLGPLISYLLSLAVPFLCLVVQCAILISLEGRAKTATDVAGKYRRKDY
jgi:hypothetical protein